VCGGARSNAAQRCFQRCDFGVRLPRRRPRPAVASEKRGDNDAMQMRSLQLNSPSESAARVKGNSERIKWQADNSLRVRPPK
jgi:hypothetical protein